MNRLFKISALLLISFASTGCQNKVPTLEEEIYNVYSKEGICLVSYDGNYNSRLFLRLIIQFL